MLCTDEKNMENDTTLKKDVTIETFICVIVFLGFFIALGRTMGAVNMLRTLMNTAFSLLMDTCLYIMAIAVLAGAIGSLLTEFGVVALLNRALSPLMKPLYGLPGAASLGIVTTYLSDNPAIIALANDDNYRRYFKPHQIPALTNIGTAFGMGAIISTYMLGLQTAELRLGTAVLIGNLGAVLGSVISTRLMIHFTKNHYGNLSAETKAENVTSNQRVVRHGNSGIRVLQSLLEGGNNGVQLGLQIIPGVLIICTFVLMLTNTAPLSGYTGSAYEGVGLLPFIGNKLSFLLEPLFGFTDSSGIAVPITALGSAGAAISLIPSLLASGTAGARDVAVFTAMCMCWSGYLSTHVAMMDSLGCSQLTGKAIFSHTIGGICAGVSANWLYALVSML